MWRREREDIGGRVAHAKGCDGSECGGGEEGEIGVEWRRRAGWPDLYTRKWVRSGGKRVGFGALGWEKGEKSGDIH